MPRTEPIPLSEPEREAFASQERVMYPDGAVNLRFAEQGDRIVWGKHKYANPELSNLDRIIVWTKSGNRYILGDQLVISMRDATVHDLYDTTERLPNITIGDPWRIPGYAMTSDVVGVELQWKIFAPGTEMGRMVDGENPFIEAEKWIEAADDTLRAMGKRSDPDFEQFS